MTVRRAPDRLARAVRALLLGERNVDVVRSSDAAARLDALEREVQEVRSRVNALFFAVLVTMYLLISARGASLSEISRMAEDSFASAGTIILITAAGGAYGGMLAKAEMVMLAMKAMRAHNKP